MGVTSRRAPRPPAGRVSRCDCRYRNQGTHEHEHLARKRKKVRRGAELLGILYTIPILSAWTRQPTRRGHPPTPPRWVNVGQSEPSDPPVFPLPDTGGSVFCEAAQGQLSTEIPR